MGDRCSLTLTIRTQDLPIWDKVFEDKVVHPKPETPGFLSYVGYDGDLNVKTLTIEQDDVNYAWAEELENAAHWGAVFLAENSAGSEYLAGLQLSPGDKKYHHWEYGGRGFLLHANPRTGRASKRDMEALRRFKVAFRKTKKDLKKLGWDPTTDSWGREP